MLFRIPHLIFVCLYVCPYAYNNYMRIANRFSLNLIDIGEVYEKLSSHFYIHLEKTTLMTI
jgi:hypothetical protein